MRPSTADIVTLHVTDVIRGYSYCAGNALQCLAESGIAAEAGRDKISLDRLREAALWLELELQRCERLSDNCIIAELDFLPNELGERGRVLVAAERFPLWQQLLRTDPSQPVCTVGTITKRAAIETLELIRQRVANADAQKAEAADA